MDIHYILTLEHVWDLDLSKKYDVSHLYQMMQFGSTFKMIPKNGHRDRSRSSMVTKIGSDTIEMITNRFHPVLDHFGHF